MSLGKIIGKVTTNHFSFKAEAEVKKFEFIQVLHKNYGDVLCQIIEIENSKDDVIAKCAIVGYKDEEGKIRQLRIPFEVNSEINLATDEFIKKIILFKDPLKGAYLGKLDGKEIEIRIDLATVLTKHVAILAKSGAGKSYTVGVLIEEILNKKVPLLIIDPHGEYSEMKNPNDDEKDRLEMFGLKPKGFRNVKEYGDIKINPQLKPLKLDDNLTASEAIQLLPGKPTGTQMGILYNAIKHVKRINFANILEELEREDNNAKWTLINSLDYINNLDIFSEIHVSYNEMISTGVCSIINLKGVPPDVQEIIVYKLLKDLFELRKQNKVPPFFTVIEEAHNYCPERSFGETKCSKVIRTIASEGRKFGLGICVVSQRPARVDKSVVSQCTTQLILKITNPNDLKAVSSSVEGITSESEEEIRNLAIGTAMVTGITDMPLFVKIRPRMTKHGGRAVNIMDNDNSGNDSDDVFEKIEDFKDMELIPIIKPKITLEDMKVMNPDYDVKAVIVPSYLFLCKEKDKEFKVLVEMENGEIVVDVDEFKTKRLPRLQELSPEEIKILKFAYTKKNFTEEDVIKKGFSLDSTKTIKELVKKDFVIKNGSEFVLSDDYIFSSLSKNACLYKVEVDANKYGDKVEKKAKLDVVKSELTKFTEVLDKQDCYVLKYVLEKAAKKKKEITEKKKETSEVKVEQKEKSDDKKKDNVESGNIDTISKKDEIQKMI